MKKLLITSLMMLVLTASTTTAIENQPVKPVMTKRQLQQQEALSKLPKDKLELFKKSEETQRTKEIEAKNKLQAARKNLKALLLIEPFNKDAYLKKAEEIAKLESDKNTSKAEAIADLASKFNADERKVLIGAFEHLVIKKYHNTNKN